MNHHLCYGWEKLFSACDYAVGSAETPQERLAGAVSGGVHLLKRENLPNDEAWKKVEA